VYSGFESQSGSQDRKQHTQRELAMSGTRTGHGIQTHDNRISGAVSGTHLDIGRLHKTVGGDFSHEEGDEDYARNWLTRSQKHLKVVRREVEKCKKCTLYT
jgi:hypothetical protein